MAQFESQKKSARNLVLSPNAQTAYGGVLADTNLTQRQRFDGSALLELPITRRTDKEQSGKGTEFATNGQITGFDSKFNFKSDLTAWLAGWAFAFAMGKDTVTGTTPTYTHALSFDESTTQAKGTTLYMEDTADVHYKVQDMAVSELTLQIGARGPCQLEVAFMGTGRYTLGTMVAALPALPTEAYLLGSDCAFSLGPVGSSVALASRHMSTTLKIATGVVSHLATGGGLYGQFMRTGLRTVSFQTTIAAKDTDDIFTLFANNTPAALAWAINSGAAAQLNIAAPVVNLKVAKLGVDGNMVVWQIEGDQNTMYGSGSVQPITVQAINGVAAYLVAA